MATFTKLTLGSKVSAVHSLSDNVATTEQAGIDFLNKLYNYPFWVQTFTDGTRKNYAGKGYTYDEDRDAFIPPKNYPSWTLNETTCRWEAPSARPDDGKSYNWNESTKSWDEII
tara:strand:+ start:150 stop:491 length:342 start_codon:yes stop_codon:yes gene_type:complete